MEKINAKLSPYLLTSASFYIELEFWVFEVATAKTLLTAQLFLDAKQRKLQWRSQAMSEILIETVYLMYNYQQCMEKDFILSTKKR
jgi:hypothetical protein